MTPPDLRLDGRAFDGRSSRPHPATLEVQGESVTLRLESGPETLWSPAQVQIEPPVPGLPRVLKFPDGSRFETRDDAAVAARPVSVSSARVARHGAWATPPQAIRASVTTPSSTLRCAATETIANAKDARSRTLR